MLRRTTMIGVLFGLGILLLFPMKRAEAQVSTGTIGGTVRHSTAAAVPGAQVAARSIETGQDRSVITDSIGSYTIPDLRVGHYSLTVIPFLCADAGALAGGWFSGWLLGRGWTLGRARGTAILLAAALAPVGILIAGAKSQAGAVTLISIVLFPFQFWVNNVQTLASDFFPNELVASISGLAGTGAGLGAMIFIFSTGWIVDHFGYTPVLIVSGLLIPAATAALGWFANDAGSHHTQKTVTNQSARKAV